MPFNIQRFIDIRSWLYHVTDRANLPRLKRLRTIETAAELLRLAGKEKEWLRVLRDEPLRLTIDGETAVLKDQGKLSFASTALLGCTEGDFIEYLNQHVFFWPGRDDGAIGSGQRMELHYEQDGIKNIESIICKERYSPLAPAILRVPTAALFDANRDQPPLFCDFNSGAPRHQPGGRVPRHLKMFVSCGDCPRAAGDVVEVVFRAAVTLTSETEVRQEDGRWQRLTLA